MIAMTMVAAASPFAHELRRWRRLRGQSQFDLALLADTTQRYLSYLEQGRSQPGRTMVLRLAESLQLTLRERNQLLGAAGYASVFEESDLNAPQLEPVRTALTSLLRGHMPYPALIADKHGDLIEANAAFDLFTEGCAPELLYAPVNVRRLALHPAGLARRIINLPEWGWFEASPRRATPKGLPSSLTQHRLKRLCLHQAHLGVRDTHLRKRTSLTSETTLGGRCKFTVAGTETPCRSGRTGAPYFSDALGTSTVPVGGQRRLRRSRGPPTR